MRDTRYNSVYMQYRLRTNIDLEKQNLILNNLWQNI